MRKSTLLISICLVVSNLLWSQIKHKYPANESFSYEEAIRAFEDLDEEYHEIKLIKTPYKTDVGRPLHVVVFNNDRKFAPNELNRKEKVVFMVNNAIHPGESCGVDATVKLFEKLGKFRKLYANVVVVAIPVYNIGGMLNRSPYKRSGQPGPAECGFRGNYQHLDLNRDFIKTDALNTEGFVQIFQSWKPNLFMDTHTTNGSDHQYTLSLITSQRNKMNPVLADYVYGKMEPLVFQKMKEKNTEIVPYVYSIKGTPDKGIKDFLETPRYSSGYANLFNSIAFISEAHKYKTFTQRVEHTYTLLEYLCEYAQNNTSDLIRLKQLADMHDLERRTYPLNWNLDTSRFEELPFKGYDYSYKTSATTGLPRIFYNRNSPKTYSIKYYRRYIPQDSIKVPRFYLLPQAYPRVVELLELNGVSMLQLDGDSILKGEMYRIEDVQSLKTPYEKHFLHTHIHISAKQESVKYYRGDYLIPTDQPSKRFIVETLEPHASDSYFRWNFFDNILQQKEWFSEFAFDPIAADLLANDENLRAEYEAKRNSDTTFAKNHFAQLYWIFQQSPYFEPEYKRYPVMRIMQ